MDKGWGKIALDKLVLAEWNYKTDDEALQEKLQNNLKRNGQVENIIVRELDTGYFEVVNGNHRLKAFKTLNWEEVMVFNLGQVSDSAARRLAIETNETKFKSDPLQLADLLKEISQSEPDFIDTAPYSQAELDQFLALGSFDPSQYNSDTPADDEFDKGPNSGLGDTGEWKKVEFNLPEGVADQLEAQIRRFKKRLYPDEQPDKVSYVMPIEAMIQTLAQIPEEQLF